MADFKSGYYGRITFEGAVDDDGDGGLLVFDGIITHRFGPKAQQQPGFKIEVIGKPLAVGDRVRHKRTGREGLLLCTLNGQAWVAEHGGMAATEMLDNLIRVSR